ncbi:YIP1 family protein [Chloroflexi bacterium TSY]|nr:YIP1 family protein [Chloroflexi bacterium TSY]
MLQPRTYPELIGKALVLEAEPFITMLEDDNPWAEGLFLTVCVGVAIGVAQLIGGLLLTASLPSADAVFAVLLHGWRELGIAPESDATRIEDTLRRIWELMTTLIGYSGGWERLFVMIIAPFNLVFQWLFVGLICYVAGRGTGGTGTLNQTLGATSLMAAPNVLYMLQIIPLVSVSGILIFFWTALIVYRAVEVVHDLSWRHSAFVTLAPLMVLLGFSMVGIVVLTMMIAGSGS